MADELKPQQDAEQEALNPAETDTPDTDEALTVEITELTDEETAEAAEDAAAEIKEDAAEAEDDLTALFAEAEAGSDTPDTPELPDADEKSAASAFSEKAGAFKDKAAGLAGKLKEKPASSLMISKNPERKRKRQKQRPISAPSKRSLPTSQRKKSNSTNGAERSGESGNSAAERAASSPAHSFC